MVAQDVRESLGLDRVIFVPARRSPFKADGGSAPAENRLEMVRAAIEGDSDFEVSRLELDRPEPSWTVDTLRSLQEQNPEARLTLMMGVDQWRSFSDWKDPLEIASMARIAVFARDGEEPGAFPGAEVVPTVVGVRRLDLSSSELRERLRTGDSIRYLVPESVRAYIRANRLYGSDGVQQTPLDP